MEQKRWRCRMVIVTVAVFVASCGQSGSGAPPSSATPTPKAYTTPPGRSFAAMAYDVRTHELVMFGGSAPSGDLNDTWAWDGKGWTARSSHTNPTIQNPVMSYDPTTRELLLVGSEGNVQPQQNSLWAWKDGTPAWVQRTRWMTPTCGKSCPASTPLPFAAGALLYDGPRSRLLMLSEAPAAPGSDTWTWDGAKWKQIPTVHRPTLLSCCIAPDRATGHLLALGYYRDWGGINRLWIFDGNDWTLSTTSVPTGDIMMIDDPTGSPLLVRSNSASNSEPGETWSWNGGAWQRLEVTSPPVLSGSSLGSDAAEKQVILFGGRDAYGQFASDTWVWNGRAWTKHP
jgi:hypothetical protein